MELKTNNFSKFVKNNLIYFLGLGYFISYIPYTALTKVTTTGLLPGVGDVTGFMLLPASVMATFATLYLFVTIKGWWKYLPTQKVFNISLPAPRWQSIISGLCTALIIVTTTLAYSFDGISIIFMIVLMRGGVLLIARVTDFFIKRKVHWYSMTAMVLTFLALVMVFAEDGGMAITFAAAVNLGLYLSGYIGRFQAMGVLAKTEKQEDKIRYFVEEQMVAMPAMLLGLGILTLVAGGTTGQALQAGFSTVLTSAAVVPALMIGLFYGILYIFGTMIYLDAREYTFCVPVNRAFSILSGIVASFILAYTFDFNLPSAYQLGGAAFLIGAILVLVSASIMEARGRQKATEELLPKVLLFICNKNTTRSPIAQAICIEDLAKKLNIPIETLSKLGYSIKSAGLNAISGTSMSTEAAAALQTIGVKNFQHSATRFTKEMGENADVIFCMTPDQGETITEMLPEQSEKVCVLAFGQEYDNFHKEKTKNRTLAFAGEAKQLVSTQMNKIFDKFSLN